MSSVIVKENETLDSALRRFKRNCAKAGIQQEIRKREHYEKPSVRRKKKSEAARKIIKKIIKLQPIWLFFMLFFIEKMLSFSILYMIKNKDVFLNAKKGKKTNVNKS